MKKTLFTLTIVLLALAAQAQFKVHDDGHVSLGSLTRNYGVQVDPDGYTYFRSQNTMDYGWSNLTIADARYEKHWIVNNNFDLTCPYHHLFFVYGDGAAFSTHNYTISGCNHDTREAVAIDGEFALSTIMKINGFYYDDNTYSSIEEIENNEFINEEAVAGMIGDIGKPSVCLSPEDLAEAFPEAVRTDPEARLCVDYNAVVAMLVEAMKQQETEIELLRKTLEEHGLIEPKKP